MKILLERAAIARQTRHIHSRYCTVASALLVFTLCSSVPRLCAAFSPFQQLSSTTLKKQLTSSSTRLLRMSAASSSSLADLVCSDRVSETLDPCVVLMKSLISRYQHLWKDRNGIYSLAQGVVYWRPPETAYQRIQQELSSESNLIHMYCEDEGMLELRSALQEKVGRENNLLHHDVMVTAGANQAYVNAVLTLLDAKRNDRAVVFCPYYFNHVMALQLAIGNDNIVYGQCDDQGIPHLDWLRATLQQQQKESNSAGRIQMVTLVNPGNPTGVTLERTVVQELVNICSEFAVWLVLDCTYEHFCHDTTIRKSTSPPSPPTVLSSSKSSFECFPDEHVLHIFSFSKGHALAGFRCGYVVMSNQTDTSQHVYQQMLKVQDTIPICPSRIAQVAALGALGAGREWVLDKVRSLETGRMAILQAMTPSLVKIMGGTGAMYVMGKLPPHESDDEDVARRLVEHYGVAVIPGSFCGFPGWIRVCYSNLPPEECQVAAERLRLGLAEICA